MASVNIVELANLYMTEVQNQNNMHIYSYIVKTLNLSLAI